MASDNSKVTAANLYNTYMRGWTHGAYMAHLPDPRFTEHEDEKYRSLYMLAYESGQLARSAANKRAMDLTGFEPNILREGESDAE